MKLNTNPPTPTRPNRTAGFLLALGAGVAAYAWKRKVIGRPVLLSLASAVMAATGASSAIRGFLLNSNADRVSADGRLAVANESKRTPQ